MKEKNKDAPGMSFLKLMKNFGIVLGVIGAFTSLLITLTPRPAITIYIEKHSDINKVFTEIKNTGNATAYNMEYTLYGEIKYFDNPNKQFLTEELNYAKGDFPTGQVFQAPVFFNPDAKRKIKELIIRYEIKYNYPWLKIFNGKGPKKLQGFNKTDGQLFWNGKKWDVR
ncbi:hypothetical protein KAR91_09645 [Candidatus Pacearchaeota archaeon]|nr:hypothetical protein [Candidatus Pacearchaeota archaeon]